MDETIYKTYRAERDPRTGHYTKGSNAPLKISNQDSQKLFNFGRSQTPVERATEGFRYEFTIIDDKGNCELFFTNAANGAADIKILK